MKHKKGKVKKQGEQYVVQDLETGNILPLKFSQIQSAIDNGEVDSDKEVEFEIIDKTIVDYYTIYAKIIPQKERIYSKQEVEKLITDFTEDMMEKNKTYSNYQQLRLIVENWMLDK